MRQTTRVMLIAAAFLACAWSASPVHSEEAGWTAAKAAALEESYRSTLHQYALLIGERSRGKSRLLPDAAVSANPTAGKSIRAVEWGEGPFISIYPISLPFRTRLLGIRGGSGLLDTGNVLGAVKLLAPSRGEVFEKDRASMLAKFDTEPGVYLIFEPDAIQEKVAQVGVRRVLLVAMVVARDGGVRFKEVLRTTVRDLVPGGPILRTKNRGVSLRFPTTLERSDGTPTGLVTVDLAWRQGGVSLLTRRFRIEMAVYTE